MKWLVKDDLNLWFFIKASEENELRNETYWELSWGKREREREREGEREREREDEFD